MRKCVIGLLELGQYSACSTKLLVACVYLAQGDFCAGCLYDVPERASGVALPGL